ncbi:MAG TPA: D-alanyl-D-alanine carboxypeptidase family protein, partial [Bacillota bacterium]|nr:D-alanyl-D-alanine carboxypeptidase family protein [Bacillota bacterium]
MNRGMYQLIKRWRVWAAVLLMVVNVLTVLPPHTMAAAAPGGTPPPLAGTGDVKRPAHTTTPPGILAKSFVLMDCQSGQVLLGTNIHQHRHQASTTKITTAILALERGKTSDVVTISKHADDTPESGIWLEQGEKLTLEQLMYALMLFSANDAATAIAEHIGGSEPAFVQMMNAKAKAIGARDSQYANPHGLDNPKHYSSAYDLALLARYGLTSVPGFAELVRTKEREIPWAGHPYKRVLRNRNKLLTTYPGADGVKTGFTDEAGRCLVASATRQGMQLIAVVMDSPDMFGETGKLLDWGFANYVTKQVILKQQAVGKVKVLKGRQAEVAAYPAQDVILPVPKLAAKLVGVKTELAAQVEAPVKAGQQLGTI